MIDRLAARIAYEVRRDTPGTTREQYSAISELQRRYATADLGAHDLRVWSQNGEDGVLAEILARVGIGDGFFVEFGVEDGLECNTRFLAEVLGWSGVYFEPDPDKFPILSARFANRGDVVTVNEFVMPATVNAQFEAAGVPETFDVLSIDVDGQDYWIWEALDGYRPSVVVIEYNSSLPADERLVEPRGAGPWDHTSYGSASIGALVQLGRRKGYELVHLELAGVNAFFVQTDHAARFAPVRAWRSPNLGLDGRGQRPGDGEYTRISRGCGARDL
jgi:hypothetical protein